MGSMMGERSRAPRGETAGSSGPGGDNLGSIRERLYRVAAVGEEKINRILSGNPEDFLRCNRQDTGE